jgi:predicted esterase
MGTTIPGSLLGMSCLLFSQTAGAQAASDCYYDANIPNEFPSGRMVDAQPLMGTLRSTPETTGTLHYLQYLPNGHDASKKWPVIVFMHGSGEKNNNPTDETVRALTKHSLPRVVEASDWNWPFIVISPQTGDGGWLSRANDISQTLDYVIENYGGDPDRIYLTGLSYGGVGTLAVGIALADKVAALLPVTPGGESVDNWDERNKIVDMPIWLFNGTADGQYENNSNRMVDIEQSGGAPFYHYDYAFLDEYKDIVPLAVMNELHVFGSYENIGHDVWHATYGIYCPNPPTLLTTKTVQYEWLLKQSRDGSPFIDPRDPNPPMVDAGVEPDSGSADAGNGGESGSGGTVSGGASGEAAGGTAGANANAGASGSNAGSSNGGSAGSPSPDDGGDEENDSKKSDGGCQIATPMSGATGFSILLGLGAFMAWRRRR